MTAPAFKRMVLGLPHSTGDYRAVGVAAKFAELLGLDLLATFAEDPDLLGLAALSCVRELRPLGAGWQPIEVAQFARQLTRAAEDARRLFHEAVRASQIAATFNAARGSIADVVGALATAEDIVVIVEPRSPAERVTRQFIRLRDAAFRSPGAVLIVPSRIARASGAVVAIATEPDDPSVRLAGVIAGAAKEQMIVFGPGQAAPEGVLEDRKRRPGLSRDALSAADGRSEAIELAARLARQKERMLIMTRRESSPALASLLATSRGVPVLVVDAAEGSPRTRVGHHGEGA